MALTTDEVGKIAWLARLKLSDEEKINLTRQLDQILTHFQHLQALNTEAVEPTSHPLPLSNVLREDEARPSFSQQEILANAPQQDQGHFVVPRIVE